VNGKSALTATINETATIDVSGLNAGVYFINIATELGSKTEKLIIQ
jgi:hypothetical protein